jgi:hypothetical protein
MTALELVPAKLAETAIWRNAGEPDLMDAARS